MVHSYHKVEILDLLISEDVRLTVCFPDKSTCSGKNWGSTTGSNKRNLWALWLQGMSAASTSLA